VAIGGIDLSNIGLVIKAGADMACAISAIVTKPDVRAEILKFQKEFGL
jgi:thiamine monophosphate synthase